MNPPIFQVCAASSSVTALLGASPTRFYKFGEAPQKVQLPYAVWQTVGGFPENYLGDAPDADTYSLQVDVYAATSEAANSVARAIRNAIQMRAHIVSWNGDDRDPVTRNFRVGFSIDWIVRR